MFFLFCHVMYGCFVYIVCISAVSRELWKPVHQFGHPKNKPKKLSSTLPKSFVFTRQAISFLLGEIYQNGWHLKCLPVGQI